MIKKTAVPLLLLIVVAACNRAVEPESVTTLSLPVTTQATTTTVQIADETTLANDDISDFEVVVRSDTAAGPEVWVVIPPGSYSDVDLEGIIVKLVESEDGLFAAHVFDDPNALVAARIDSADRTAEEQALVDGHYLVSLLEGSVVRFQGPFADLGEYVFGS